MVIGNQGSDYRGVGGVPGERSIYKGKLQEGIKVESKM